MVKSDGTGLGSPETQKKLTGLISKAKSKRYTLIKVLSETQKIYGFLPESVLKEIAKQLPFSESEIFSVATFYSVFSLKPKGKHVISVCLGTTCYIKGADKLLEKIYAYLNIKAGEVSEDGLFSVDETRCLGCCGLAPVIKIDDKIYSHVETENIAGILAEWK